MGPSVSDLPKILLIVEGERREADFFHALAEQCGIPAAFYAVGGNISMLYGMMEKEGFTCNVKDLLLERVRDGQDRQILEQNYAETYFIFDCDAQHTQDKREHGTFSDKEIAAHVMARVRKMAEQLNNETDPTRGKLYVNYPSIESYRDADACYDESYRSLMKKWPIGIKKNKDVCRKGGSSRAHEGKKVKKVGVMGQFSPLFENVERDLKSENSGIHLTLCFSFDFFITDLSGCASGLVGFAPLQGVDGKAPSGQ